LQVPNRKRCADIEKTIRCTVHPPKIFGSDAKVAGDDSVEVVRQEPRNQASGKSDTGWVEKRESDENWGKRNAKQDEEVRKTVQCAVRFSEL
jgi:hypothetical protein